MENLFSLVCFAALILVALFAFASMMRRGGGSAPYAGDGNEFPRYDDPNVSSGGSFGRRSAGSTGFGGGALPGASRGGTLGEERPRHDDPNVRSGGSFGG